jgi:hypothetical protein
MRPDSTRRRLLDTFLIAIAMAVLCGAADALAGGRVIEEQFKIQIPGPTDQIVSGLGMDGPHLIVATRRNFGEPDGSFWSQVSAYLFQRTNRTEWRFVKTLATAQSPSGAAVTYRAALEGNVAAIEANELRIFEYSQVNGWQQAAVFPATSDHYIFGGSLAIGGGTVVTGGSECAWAAYSKNASAQWTRVAGEMDPMADFQCFADLDATGSTIVVGVSRWYENRAGEIRIYSNFSSTPASTLPAPNGDVYFGGDVAIHGDTLVTASPLVPGIQSYRLSGGSWQSMGSAATADAWINQLNLNVPYVELNQEFVVGAYPFDGQRGPAAGSVTVFRKNPAGSLTEVARLLASDAGAETALGTHVAVSGRHVAAAAGYGGQATVYVFELPVDLSQPSNTQDDFEAGNFARWSPLAGSALSVASTSRSRVLRQSNLTADAGAYLMDMDWTNQSIQTDVRATAFNGADRWFGLVVRRTDPANYYYVTVRASNVIQLRRMLNGQFQPIASAPLPVTLNRDYRLRLEAIGTRIRAYVDGQLMVEARDTSHSHGHAGVQMYQARADYDNVVVTANPQLTIASDNFEYGIDERWSVIDGNWQPRWYEDTATSSYSQSSTAGDARTITGANTDDQIVQVDARLMKFGNGGNAWFGVMGRYVDSRNYYYATLRSNGTISLRKLVNGSITALATANFTALPEQWHRIRFEIVGNALRVFVDDQLRLQARDSTFAKGRHGLVTYHGSAEYKQLMGWQP